MEIINIEEEESESKPKGFASSLRKLSFDEDSTWLRRAIFVLLATMLIFSTVAYGAVDVWMIGVNSIFAGLIVIFWLVDAWKTGEFRFNTSILQIPLLALIVIGIIQLLPLGDSAGVNEILTVSSSASLSLDPYLTRLFVIQLIDRLRFFLSGFDIYQ